MIYQLLRAEIGQYAADYELLRVLVKIEGGAKRGTAHLQR